MELLCLVSALTAVRDSLPSTVCKQRRGRKDTWQWNGSTDFRRASSHAYTDEEEMFAMTFGKKIKVARVASKIHISERNVRGLMSLT